MGKYLDPKADVTFKKVFGEHKNLLISFLNALLPLDEGKQVESIEYLPPELVPRTPIDKDTSVDVRCEETGGRKFIVEMQMNWTTAFKQRVLFNASKVYVRQLGKGEDYELLQPVYSLNLVNANFEPDIDEYYHYYRLVHNLHTNKVMEGLHLVFIELPKFKAKNFAEKKMQALWLRFLTEISETTREAPKELIDDPHVNEALEVVEESAYDEAEMYAYDRFWDFVSRKNTEIGEAKRAQAAIKQARAELKKAKADVSKAKMDASKAKADANKAKAELAVEKARADEAKARADALTAERDLEREKLRQTVRKMKSKGFSDEDITDFTGLSKQEIAELNP